MATVPETTSDPLAVATWSEEGDAPSKSERYLAKRLAAAGADFKGAAVTTFLLAAGVAAMAWLVCGVLAEHWLVPGGLPAWARWAWLAAGLAALAAAAIRWLLPLVRYRVNLVYAARALEREHPELHNDVVNAVLARARAEATAPLVVKSLRRRAARQLSDVPSDGVVDRTPAVRLAYALALLVGLACVYELVAPKSLVTTAARLVAPWLGIATPSRVRIEPPELTWRMPGEPAATPVGDRRLTVVGGETTIVRGRQLVVSARIRGLASAEPATLVATPVDASGSAWRTVLARGPDGEHVAVVPDATRGMDHSLDLDILAGDARSDRLRVAVVDAASLLVRELRYDYPDYTRQADESVEWQGDIRAIEGTNVTIVAESNQPLEAAWLDLGCDGKRDVTLAIGAKDLTRARGTFTLRLNADRTGPEHAAYRLMFQPRSPSQAGREAMVTEKLEHRIEVLPDLAPEVAIEEPAEKVVRVPPDAPVAIRVQASDPDFGLASVRLETRLQAGTPRPGPELLQKPAKRFRGTTRLVPQQLGAGPGTVLEYRAVAADGRPSQPNTRATEWYALKIDADAPPRAMPPEPERQPDADADGGDGEAGDAARDGSGERSDSDDASRPENRDGGADERGADEGTSDDGKQGRQGHDSAGDAGGKAQEQPDAGGESPAEREKREQSQRQQDPTGGDEQAAPQEGKEQGSGEGGKPQTGDQGKAGKQQGSQPRDGSEDGAGSEPQGQGGQGQDGTGQAGGQREQPGPAQPAAGGKSDGKAGDGAQEQKQGQKSQGGQATGESRGGEGQEREGQGQGRGKAEGRDGDGERRQADGKSASGGRSGQPKPKESVAADGTDDGKAMERILANREQSEPKGGNSDRQPGATPPQCKGADGKPCGKPGCSSCSGGGSGAGKSGQQGQGQGQQGQGDGRDGQAQQGQGQQGQGQQGQGQQGQGQQGQGEGRDDQAQQGQGQQGQGEGRDGQAQQGQGQQGQGQQGQGQQGQGQQGQGEGRDSQAQQGQGQQGQGQQGQGQQGQGQQGQGQQGQGQQGQGQQGQGEGRDGQAQQGQGQQGQQGDNVGEVAAGQTPAGNQVGGGGQAQLGGPKDGGGAAAEGPREPKEVEWGEQDLAHARNAADLAIEHLKNAVDSGGNDVLDDLGWSREQARAFIDRWEAMRRQAREGDPGKRAEFDRAVKSLGIRPRGVRSSRDVPPDAKGGQAEGRRSRPPSDYREQFKAFMQATGKE